MLALAEGVAALRELVRVTRPRGSVILAAWDQDAPAAPQYLAYDVFAELFPGHRLWPDGFFPAWSRNTIATNLREAGCDGVHIHIWEGEWRVPSPENIWDDSGPSLSRFPGFQALDAVERQRFAQAFTAAVVRRSDHERVARLTTRACIGIGRAAH